MTHTTPTDTPPAVADALAGLLQQREELCAALSDIYATASIVMHSEKDENRLSQWARVRAMANEAVRQARRTTTTEG